MTVTKRKSKPATAHPMFPLVTALWVATLLGLGSFAVAPALLEGPVVALGIPALVPAAAPPLGFTARLLFALAMMGAGGVAGYALGRAIGRGKVEAPVRARGFGKPAQDTGFEPRRPINPTEDLGEPLDAPVAQDMPLRRRALSLQDESQLSMPAESAPLPGFLPWEHAANADAAHTDETGDEQRESDFTQFAPQPSAVPDPLALDLLFEDAQSFEQAHSEPEPEAIPETVFETTRYEAPEAFPAPTVAPAEPTRFHASTPIHQAQPVTALPLEQAPLEGLGLVQLVERLALAISRRARKSDAPAAEPVASFIPPAPEIARFSSAPLVPTAFHNIEPERVVQLRPAQLQPVMTQDFASADEADDEDEEADLGLDRFLRMSPLRTREPKAETFDVADDDFAPEPEVAEDRYPSLLDIGPVVARREPLRIDDGMADEPADEADIEPLVVFPGQQTPQTGQTRQFERPSIMPLPGSPLAAPGRAAPSPQVTETDDVSPWEPSGNAIDADEADRALRAALATLQRMTAQG